MLPDAAVYRQKVFQILSFFFSAAYYMGCLGRPRTHSGQFRQSHMAIIISHMLLLVTEVKPCWQGLLYSDGLPSAKSVFLAFFLVVFFRFYSCTLRHQCAKQCSWLIMQPQFLFLNVFICRRKPFK